MLSRKRTSFGKGSSGDVVGALGTRLESQGVHGDNLEFVFGLVKGYGVVQSIWEYIRIDWEDWLVLRNFSLDTNDLGG